MKVNFTTMNSPAFKGMLDFKNARINTDQIASMQPQSGYVCVGPEYKSERINTLIHTADGKTYQTGVDYEAMCKKHYEACGAADKKVTIGSNAYIDKGGERPA